MSERCQRCGEIGEDRRTLWMSCFYAMEELGLPFEDKVLFQVPNDADIKPEKAPVQIPLGDGNHITLDPGTFKTESPLTPMRVYTLRVCKECRGEWMGAIEQWFKVKPQREEIGSGIFVRENGATVEISEEEWYRRNPGREPVRVLKESENTHG